MQVTERLKLINEMCSKLAWTSSRLDKEYIVSKYKNIDSQLARDIDYVFEVLSGMHKLGYTFLKVGGMGDNTEYTEVPIEEYLKPLYSIEYKSESNIVRMCMNYGSTADYLEPILNRVWRIGINKSQVAKQDTSPMLAKKYEPGKHCKNKEHYYYITEKLDGNRCLARYNEAKSAWEFISRSGKLLKVNFDMQNLSTKYVYDGEILSLEQLKNPGQHNFNTLSGIINSIYSNEKDKLVYEIFDIANIDDTYQARRFTLEKLFAPSDSNNVQLLPVLMCINSDNLESAVTHCLKTIEERGGEGVMINDGSRKYEHKRTDALLKVKSVYTMDMYVYDIEYGTGKYEDAIGALLCRAVDKDKNIVYECAVGSGLSDDERYSWVSDESKIVGKIVEVAYFSISQDKNCNKNVYSLRFPRYKGIRGDKTDTSVD